MIVWSDAAQALFELSSPTGVSAGAGSGKTTCLVELCIRLLSGEATGTACDPGEIVAITFTEKAATELEERLREAVVRRARAAPDPDEARAWRMRLHALDRMAVGTIHGFARRLLREYALDAALDPELDVVDEETSRAWRREAARAAVVAALDARRAETQGLAAAMGAGGRRTGLADIVADLARERATLGDTAPLQPAPDCVADAFAARAVALGTAEALLGARDVSTPTGRRALGQLAEALATIDPADREGPLRPESLASFGALPRAVRSWRPGKSDGERSRALKDELARACGAFLAAAAEGLAGAQKRELCLLVTDAEERYRARKRAARVVDFDDLLVAARDLLATPDGPRHELRRRFRALLVDEYQDVNRLQHQIFELLARDDGAADGPLLVAVGDLKQSIYRFRGADVSVFRALLDRFGNGSGRVLQLRTNHRSSPSVLDLVNAVSSSCMQPRAGDPRDYELAFGEGDRLLAARAVGQEPPCEILEDDEEGSSAERRRREARGLAARIGALVSGVAGVEVRERPGDDGREGTRRPRHGDIALLFRRLTQIGEYERALREAGIPYRLARGGGFYQAPEVRDLGELLATLTDPGDTLGWAALLRSPFCGVSDGALFAVSRLGWTTLARRDPREVSDAIVAADEDAASEAERVRRFLATWQDLRALRDRLPLPELLSRAVESVDLEAAHLASPDGERRLVNVRKALALAARFAARGGTAAGFAERLRTMAKEPPREPEADLDGGDAVALLSVHQAKGLEWPIVFVPDMGAAAPRETRRALRDPSGAVAVAFYDAATDSYHATRSLLAAREEAARAAAAESRRLLYVALTRARDRLVLSGEAGRAGDTWRALVEAAIGDRSDLVVRVPVAEAATFSVRPGAGQAICAPSARSEPGEGRTGDVLPVLAGPPPLAAVRVAVTQLAEYARCPRRVFLARHVGAPEHGSGSGLSQDDPDRATARGTLAHAMIAEIDLTASPLERRAQLTAVATRRGYDAHAAGVRRIAADVWRFLDSAPGRALARSARAGKLRREVPLVLRLDGDGFPSCYLVGAIDALAEDGRGVAVIDFKYALARPGAAERYRLQLLAYALAARRAFPGRQVTARLQFIRGPCISVDLTPGARELRDFEREVPRIAVAAHAAGVPPPTAEELGRTPRQCATDGCGFVSACHGRDARTGGRIIVAA